MRKIIPFAGGLLLGLGVGVIIFFGFLKPETPLKVSDLLGPEALPVPEIDAPAPDFELVSLSGDSIRLEDYRGQFVLLNFWATWCAPCRTEMPGFQRLSEDYPDQLAVVAVNNAETAAEVQPFVDELNLSFDILLDLERDVQRLYQLRGYPTSFILDQDGIIRAQKLGTLTEAEVETILLELGMQR